MCAKLIDQSGKHCNLGNYSNAMAIENQQELHFPAEFIFVTATASYQMEGAVQEGGRGLSIWDTFSHTLGRVRIADTGDIAIRHETFHNALFFDPLFKGCYPESIVEHVGDYLPHSWQQNMTTIAQPLNYWGLNYYTPIYVTDAFACDNAYPATASVERPGPATAGVECPGVKSTDCGWEDDAGTLTDLLIKPDSHHDLPPCYIAENGAACNHEINNVDYKTQTCTPNNSALWYQDLLEQHNAKP